MKAVYKQSLLTLALIVLVIPHVALAAWWNPFTWKIFISNKTPKTRAQQVPNAATTQATSTTTVATTTVKAKVKNDEKDVLIDSLKKQVADLTQKANETNVKTPKTLAQMGNTEYGTTTLIQTLEEQIKTLTARQKQQFQPYPPPFPQASSTTPTVSDTSTLTPVLPKKVTRATLTNSSIILQTTFPVDVQSFHIVAFDRFEKATSSFTLQPNMANIITDRNFDKTYKYSIQFATTLSQLFTTTTFYTTTFQITFKGLDGIATTSQLFVFGNGFPPLVPMFNNEDVINAAIGLQF